MRKHVADAVDWYLNKMNTLHFIPTNLATMARDIAAKQIGGEGFRPRPLKAENFTDAELDAIKALSDKAKKNAINYYSYIRLGKRSLGDRRVAGKDIASYLSPLNVVRTTLGAFSTPEVDGQKRVRDVYDFNQEKLVKVFDHGDGTVSFRNKGTNKIERVLKSELGKMLSRAKDGAYGIIRQNAANFGHTDKDPDSDKIKVDIPMSEIDKRLGNRAGTFDISAKPSEGEFKRMGAGAGAMTGAPVGAVLGALTGAMLLVNKNRRKKWLRTMLTSVLAGTAIGALTGGAGGYALAGSAIRKFNSNPNNDQIPEKSAADLSVKGRRKKGKSDSDFRSKVMNAIAYSIPIVAAAGIGAYGLSQLGKFKDRMLNPEQQIGQMKDVPIEFVKDLNMI